METKAQEFIHKYQQYHKGYIMLKIGVIIMAIFGFLYANWFMDLFDDTPKPPIYVPIDMTKAGNTAEMVIRSDDSEKTRYFTLFFATRVDGKYDFHRNSWIYKFIGNVSSIKGTVTPVKLTIYRLEKDKEPQLFRHKTIEAEGMRVSRYKLNGREGLYLGRLIYLEELPKGKYRIKLENLKSFPELKGIEIYFAIHGDRGKY